MSLEECNLLLQQVLLVLQTFVFFILQTTDPVESLLLLIQHPHCPALPDFQCPQYEVVLIVKAVKEMLMSMA